MNEWYLTEAERIASGFSPANGTDAAATQYTKKQQHAIDAAQTFYEHDAPMMPAEKVNAISRGFALLFRAVGLTARGDVKR